MAGPSGFMLFGTIDHGTLLSVFAEEKDCTIRCRQSAHCPPDDPARRSSGLVRSPADSRLRRRTGNTCLEYDQPSSLFGQFNDDRITSVANELDRKMEELVRAAVE